jgi:hypothetical protein
MPDLTKFTFSVRNGNTALIAEESEAFLAIARGADGLPVEDATGTVIGTFYASSADVWDDATGTPEEDAEDIRRAYLAMQEEGSIPLEELELELKLRS